MVTRVVISDDPNATAATTFEELAPDPQPLPRNELPTVEWEYVDRELAEQYLSSNENNRKARRDTVSVYARDLEHGKWEISGDSIKFDKTGRLIDGQHRLMAIATSNVGAWQLIVRGLEPRVQRVLDTQARRSAADALRFAGVERNAHMIAAIARAAITYDDFMQNRECAPFINTAAPSHSEVESWVAEHVEVHEAAIMASQLHKAAGTALTAWGLAWIKFLTIDPVESREFFQALANKSTNGKGDPRFALLGYAPVGKARGRIAMGEQLCAITVAWNFYREGKDLEIIRTRINGKYRPIPVAQ